MFGLAAIYLFVRMKTRSGKRVKQIHTPQLSIFRNEKELPYLNSNTHTHTHTYTHTHIHTQTHTHTHIKHKYRPQTWQNLMKSGHKANDTIYKVTSNLLQKKYYIPPAAIPQMYLLWEQGWRDIDMFDPSIECQITSVKFHTFKVVEVYGKTEWNSFQTFHKRPTPLQASKRNYADLNEWDEKAKLFKYQFTRSYSQQALLELSNNNNNNNNNNSNNSNDSDDASGLKDQLPDLDGIFHTENGQQSDRSDSDIDNEESGSDQYDHNDSDYVESKQKHKKGASKSKRRKNTKITTTKSKPKSQSKKTTKQAKSRKNKNSSKTTVATLKKGRQGMQLLLSSTYTYHTYHTYNTYNTFLRSIKSTFKQCK